MSEHWYEWSELRELAVRRFKDVPSAGQEQRIIDVFNVRPELVSAAIDHVAQRFDAGTVSNPWPFLATHVEKAVVVQVDVRASDASSKERAIRQAEQWLKSAGVHCPSEPELLGELYGESELTPPLGFLLGLEVSTRDAPGRSYFEGLLHAQIARTLDEGQQAIPETTGILRDWADDLALRERLLELWRAERPRGQLTEAEMETRAARLVLQRKTANVTTSSEEAA